MQEGDGDVSRRHSHWNWRREACVPHCHISVTSSTTANSSEILWSPLSLVWWPQYSPSNSTMLESLQGMLKTHFRVGEGAQLFQGSWGQFPAHTLYSLQTLVTLAAGLRCPLWASWGTPYMHVVHTHTHTVNFAATLNLQSPSIS